jgi:hypothetical protein
VLLSGPGLAVNPLAPAGLIIGQTCNLKSNSFANYKSLIKTDGWRVFGFEGGQQVADLTKAFGKSCQACRLCVPLACFSGVGG